MYRSFPRKSVAGRKSPQVFSTPSLEQELKNADQRGDVSPELSAVYISLRQAEGGKRAKGKRGSFWRVCQKSIRMQSWCARSPGSSFNYFRPPLSVIISPKTLVRCARSRKRSTPVRPRLYSPLFPPPAPSRIRSLHPPSPRRVLLASRPRQITLLQRQVREPGIRS